MKNTKVKYLLIIRIAIELFASCALMCIIQRVYLSAALKSENSIKPIDDSASLSGIAIMNFFSREAISIHHLLNKMNSMNLLIIQPKCLAGWYRIDSFGVLGLLPHEDFFFRTDSIRELCESTRTHIR